MKKLVVLVAIAMCVGCGGKHVVHTHFGDFDLDTMEVAFYDMKDSLPCYLVLQKDIDSIEKAPGEWGYIYGPLKYYYCPQKNTYYHSFPDNQGHAIFRGYDPSTDEYCNPDEI